jgi:hypothetical protein
MRARGALIAVVAGSLLLVPSPALANGGAYIALDGTHYEPGSTAVATAYVSVPKGKQALLEQGPFYAYVLPGNAAIRKGEPIPDEAIRVGTFAIERERPTQFELVAEFTVPEIDGDVYSIQMCNDPCTLTGFREQLWGQISIVATPREAELLIEQQRLTRRFFHVRRDAHRAEKELAELRGTLAQAEADNAALAEMVNDLRQRRAPAATDRAATTSRRPLVDPWAAALIAVAVLALAVAVAKRRRRAPIIATGVPR